MKTNKKKEQFELAELFFEMGMDYEVIEKITGINGEELLLNKIDMVEFENKEETDLNINDEWKN